MEIESEPIFKPWFKVFVCGCFVLVAMNAIVTGHLSPVRITKKIVGGKAAEVVEGRLVLNAGDTEIKFPLLTYVPKNDAIEAALRNGVEIRPNGEVIGLLQIECPGFFNPVSYQEEYVNLVALAILTDSGCINSALTEDMAELVSIVEQMPKSDRFRKMEPGGWRLVNMAWLNAVTEVILKMPRAKCILKGAAMGKYNDNNEDEQRTVL